MTTKQCIQCSKTFRIDDRDLEFYKKINVPEPTHCPDCRQQRRMAWRNERKLYARQCDLCKKSIIAMYSPDKPFTVYCPDCWWSDQWDPLDFGMDYQPGKSFLEQLHELQLRVPRIALYGKNNENSPYSNHSDGAKNSYLVVDVAASENIHYSKWIIGCKDCADCYQLQNAELAYENTYCNYPYNVVQTHYSDKTNNTWFTYHSSGSSNCFLATNQHNQQYVLRNKLLKQSEYEMEVQKINTGSYTQFTAFQIEFENLLKTTIRRYAEQTNCEQSTGDNLFSCSNVLNSFHVIESTNSRYCYDAGHLTDCYDVYESAFNCELQYEMHGCNRTSFSKFCSICYDNSFIEYCDMCHNSKQLFGCVAVRKGEYVILNKQYTQAEYEQLKAEIITNMQQAGEYGEFFPAQNSPFAYNESTAQEHFPLSQEQALSNGWFWKNDEIKPQTIISIAANDLPDHIQDATVDITKTVIRCLQCKKLYRVIAQEIELYKKLNVPLPRLCSDCRYRERLAKSNPWRLWQRQCMCTQIDHVHQGRCNVEFETSYAPDRIEIVYCEECYQKEIY